MDGHDDLTERTQALFDEALDAALYLIADDEDPSPLYAAILSALARTMVQVGVGIGVSREQLLSGVSVAYERATGTFRQKTN